ncbi:MAG: tetratricopeptide repeat protein [Candidatus Hydrogenedens sp.]|jgi:hypothetical protein|nr:tetratricopeptide repeat protein [Candidatus Hydrogenedens sp.]
MSKHTDNARKHHPKEWLCILLLFLYGLTVGLVHFESLREDGKSAVFVVVELYGPALMMACGHGFLSPDQSLYPELHKFLEGEQETFSKDLLPADIETTSSAVAAYHRYLLYMVAAVWRIFGISWAHLEIVISVMLGWYAVSLYLLFRFFLSRILSLLSTLFFIVSPAVMTVLPDLRDFSKAPFTVTLLCILLWLFNKRTHLQFQIIAAAVLGTVHGIALGFRQDTLVLFPLCVCVLTFPILLKPDTERWKRLFPLLIYLSLFFLLSSPLLKRMEGAAQPQHALVQGFAKDRLDLLGMKEAPYYTVLSGADYYTFAMLYSFADRSPDLSTPDFSNDKQSEIIGQRWLQESAFLYPADLIARAWAAVCQSFRYSSAFPPSFSEPTRTHNFIYDLHRSFAFAMHYAGVPLAITAFILLARQFPAQALWLFLATSYVLGYTSLQASSRHSFHLSFTSLLVLCFCLEALIKKLWSVENPSAAVSLDQKRNPYFFWGTLLSCFFIIFPPLWMFRWHQTQQLRPIIENCIQAPRTPLSVSQEDCWGWTIFSLESSETDSSPSELKGLYKLAAACFNKELKLWHSREKYLMAEFEATADLNHLMHLYGAPTLDNNFSQLLRLPKVRQSGEKLRYFFPVYELLKPEWHGTVSFARNSFKGIAVPKELAPHFSGLYEIRLPKEITHLISFACVDDKIPNPLYCSPDSLPDPLYYYHTEARKFRNTAFSEAAKRFHKKPEAVLFSEAQVILADEPQLQFPAVQNLIIHNQQEKSLGNTSADEAINFQNKRLLWDTLELIAKLYLYQGPIEYCLAALDAMEALEPEKYSQSALLRIEAYERTGLKKEALEVYQKYLRLSPEDQSSAAGAHILMYDFLSPEEKYAFWLYLVDTTPDEPLFLRYLALALDLLDKEDLAKDAYRRAYKLDPTDPQNIICHTVIESENTTFEETKHQIMDLAALHPQEHVFIVERLEKEAWYSSEKGRHDKAARLLLLAAEYGNNRDTLILRAHQQFTGAGDYQIAEDGLLTLLEGSCAHEAAQALYITTKLNRDSPDRFHFWLDLQNNHPDNENISSILTAAYEEAVRELFISARLEELIDLSPPKGDFIEENCFPLLYPKIARYITGLEKLDTIQSALARLENSRETISSDLKSLAIALTTDASSKRAERIALLQNILENAS